MKRIVIVGIPGSGKSTYAKLLGKKKQIPVYHLDTIVFKGKVKRDRDEFLAKQREIVATDTWIIEGCGISSIEMRLFRADTVIYFDFSRLLCLFRLFKRDIFHREDSANTGCIARLNSVLIRYVWSFKKEEGPLIEKALIRHPHLDVHRFRNVESLL